MKQRLTLSDVALVRWRSLAVGLVAVVAALQSYRHIYELMLAQDHDKLGAALLPLSVDGLVLAASITLVVAQRTNKGKTDGVAWLMLGLGATATLCANVAVGWHFGVIAAIGSGWPAVAFIGAAEMAFRSQRTSVVAERQSKRPAAAPASTGKHTGRAPAPAQSRSETSTEAAAMALMTANPKLRGAELAKLVNVPERTARRYAERYRPPAPADVVDQDVAEVTP